MLLPRLAALAAEFRRACGLASPFGGFAPRALPTTARPFRPLEGSVRDEAVKRTTAAVRRLPPCWLRTATPGRCFGATSSQPTAVAPLPLPLTARHLRCMQRDQTCPLVVAQEGQRIDGAPSRGDDEPRMEGRTTVVATLAGGERVGTA